MERRRSTTEGERRGGEGEGGRVRFRLMSDRRGRGTGNETRKVSLSTLLKFAILPCPNRTRRQTRSSIPPARPSSRREERTLVELPLGERSRPRVLGDVGSDGSDHSKERREPTGEETVEEEGRGQVGRSKGSVKDLEQGESVPRASNSSQPASPTQASTPALFPRSILFVRHCPCHCLPSDVPIPC